MHTQSHIKKGVRVARQAGQADTAHHHIRQYSRHTVTAAFLSVQDEGLNIQCM